MLDPAPLPRVGDARANFTLRAGRIVHYRGLVFLSLPRAGSADGRNLPHYESIVRADPR